ncbi:MAG TPA: hypothetical protein VG738_06110 [Chitinophagaceae bacterium]|nr:hypothetical protein [Chitinophagaceae bacterium]
MENNFEKYVDDNRAAFEKGAPAPAVWQNIKAGVEACHAKKRQAKKVMMMRWAAAAILLLAAGGAAVFFPHRQKAVIAVQDKNKPQQYVKPLPANKDSLTVKQPAEEIAGAHTLQNDVPARTTSDEYNHSILYYEAVVKTKEQQVDKLLAGVPELNKEFKRAIDDLDAIIKQLEVTLPQSVDKEKILQGIIKNLQMQESVLNSQLEALKSLQKNADEQKNG